MLLLVLDSSSSCECITMLISEAVSDVSSVSLNVGNEKGFAGRGVGCLLLHFFSCVELSSVLLVGAALGLAMVRVSMECDVGLCVFLCIYGVIYFCCLICWKICLKICYYVFCGLVFLCCICGCWCILICINVRSVLCCCSDNIFVLSLCSHLAGGDICIYSNCCGWGV